MACAMLFIMLAIFSFCISNASQVVAQFCAAIAAVCGS